MLDILILLMAEFILITSCFMAGYAIIYNSLPHQKLVLPVSLVIGSIVIVSTISIVSTLGRTYSWLFVSLLLIWKLVSKSDSSQEISFIVSLKSFVVTHKKTLIFHFLVLIAFFGVKIGDFWSDGTILFHLDNDQVFYSRIAAWINLLGEENPTVPFSLFSTDYQGCLLYHYYEHWLASIFINVISPVAAMFIIVHVFFLWMIYLASISVLELVSDCTSKWGILLIHLLAIVFPFSSSIYLTFFTKLTIPAADTHHFIYGNQGISYYHIKIAILETFFLISWLFFIVKKEYFAILTWLLLVVISPATAPVLLTSSCVFALYKIILSPANRKKYILLFSSACVMAVVIALSLYLFAPMVSFNANFSVDQLNSSFLEYFSLRTIQKPILYLPFSMITLILLVYFREYTKWIWIIGFILVFASAFGSIFEETNWKQFFSMAVYPNAKILFTTFTIGLGIKLFFSRKSIFIKYIILSSLTISVALLSFRTVRNIQLNWQALTLKDTNYESQIINQLNVLDIKHEKGILGGFYDDPTNFKKVVSHSQGIFAEIHSKGTYVYFSKKPTIALNFNLIDYVNHTESSYMKNYIKRSPLYLFAIERNIPLTNIDKIKTDFSKHFNIRFFIVNQVEDLPEELQNYVSRVITNSKTGEKFCLMDYSIQDNSNSDAH